MFICSAWCVCVCVCVCVLIKVHSGYRNHTSYFNRENAMEGITSKILENQKAKRVRYHGNGTHRTQLLTLGLTEELRKKVGMI